jgi:FkbM family methyltransferase
MIASLLEFSTMLKKNEGNSWRQSGAARSFGWSCLTLVLRAGRITRFLPTAKGFFTLQRLYRRFLPAGFMVRTKLEGKLFFDLDLKDDLGLYLWNYPDFYEKEEIEAFCSFITPGSVVLDVGANFGLYTVLAAKRGAQVFAIEPDPRNVSMLRHNVNLNRLEKQVTIVEMAATETEKAVPLYRSLVNMGESNILQKGLLSGSVKGRTIDSLNLPPVDVCKMDIEGSEFLALQGMQRTLKRSPQIKLFIEYAEVFPDSQPLLQYLRTNFTTLRVMEAPQSDPWHQVPSFCNIFATRAAEKSA